MPILVNTEQLLEEGLIQKELAQEMHRRSRVLMVNVAINSVLCFGIISATAGLIVYLGNPTSVAAVGVILLAVGLWILSLSKETFQMFGNAAALIGAGLLIGGAGIELSGYGPSGILSMIIGGALVGVIALWRRRHNSLTSPFIIGSIAVMGGALHIAGCLMLLEELAITGLLKSLTFLYISIAIAATGWHLNVKTITALAIAPFAQVLETGSSYFHAAYVFYSPESTLSILQMLLLIVVLGLTTRSLPERHSRHSGILSVMGFIVANLCALVGSLWGDVVGKTIWGPGNYYNSRAREHYETYEAWEKAEAAFLENAWVISDTTYSIIWAICLILAIFWFSHKNQRGLFNASLTFAALHAYTQAFESYYDKPLAYVIGGFAAIPLAWGMWKLNQRMI